MRPLLFTVLFSFLTWFGAVPAAAMNTRSVDTESDAEIGGDPLTIHFRAVETPAGPTGVSLDRGALSLGLEWAPEADLMGTQIVMGQLRYGLTDRVTLGAAVSISNLHTFFLNPKWNIYRSSDFYLSIGPWVGYRARQREFTRHPSIGGSEENYALWSGEIAATRVLDESHLFHASFFAGEFDSQNNPALWDYQSDQPVPAASISNYYVYSQLNYVARLSVAYDWQFLYRHGMTFSVLPTFSFNRAGYRAAPGLPETVIFITTHTDLGLGIAYHYRADHFGLALGVVAGPRWSRDNSLDDGGFRLLSGAFSVNYEI